MPINNIQLVKAFILPLTSANWVLPLTTPTPNGLEDANDDVGVHDRSLHHVHNVSGWYETIRTVPWPIIPENI
jgi:hypothetical protein